MFLSLDELFSRSRFFIGYHLEKKIYLNILYICKLLNTILKKEFNVGDMAVFNALYCILELQKKLRRNI